MDIKLEAVSKSFGDRVLFEDLNLQIKQGDFLIVKGASGSGKTTLGSIIGNMEKPTTGKVVYSTGKKNLYRKHIGFIFQNYGLLENENIYKNLEFAFIGKDKQDDTSLCYDALRQVGLNCELKDKVKSLSGGEKQRLAIARVLLKDPDVIIADEPTGNLDLENTEGIDEMLIALNKMGKTIILITHKEFVYPEAKVLNL